MVGLALTPPHGRIGILAPARYMTGGTLVGLAAMLLLPETAPVRRRA